MKRIKNIWTNGKQFIFDSYSDFKSKQIIKAYTQKNDKKVINQCQQWNTYKYILINRHKFIFFLISEQDNDMIDKILLKNPIKKLILEDDENPNNFFPITFSILNDCIKTNELLLQHGANINQIHKDGNNLTHVCAFFNKLQPLNYTIQKGVNFQQQNERGDTPLHLAAMQGHTDIIEELLKQKIDTNIKNNDHHLAIHEAILFGQLNSFQLLYKYYNGIKKNDESPHIVFYASMQETSFILNDIIQNNKALVNLRDQISDAVPLHFSVNSNSQECTRLLLDNGALTNVKDKFGNTPLHLAVEKKNLDICKLLCLNGAEIDIENEDKLTAKDLADVDVDKTISNYFKTISRFSKLYR